MSIRLNVIDREGKKTTIDVEEDTTIRDAIEEKLSPDNYGVCGGNCSCGTCHVYFAPGDFEKLNPKSEAQIKSVVYGEDVNIQGTNKLLKDTTS